MSDRRESEKRGIQASKYPIRGQILSLTVLPSTWVPQTCFGAETSCGILLIPLAEPACFHWLLKVTNGAFKVISARLVLLGNGGVRRGYPRRSEHLELRFNKRSLTEKPVKKEGRRIKRISNKTWFEQISMTRA